MRGLNHDVYISIVEVFKLLFIKLLKFSKKRKRLRKHR